ncbi:MAG TPA: F0F1 ATP synthase subunit B [Patescibacteria group bacterium]|nr:F0F1 ATP synthase subunit B [Patescibacteria group bacterium]
MIFDPNLVFVSVAHAAEQTASSGNPAAALGLNVKLFIAQLINFGILLLIFWKWVFPAVTKGLRNRTERIEKALSDAERIEREKREFSAWREQETTKARQEASALITDAQSQGLQLKQQLADETKAEQQKIVEQAKQQISSEKAKAITEAKTEIADLVIAASEKILRKKLDAKADQELIKNSLANMRTGE